jgi:RES domain-containing protein
VRAWRAVRPAYAANPLSGEGAARAGSRWNSPGVRLGYASTSRPLAVLETLVHATRGFYPVDAVLVPVDIPDEMVADVPSLPKDWSQLPYSAGSRLIGDHWVKQGSSLAMLVPSAVLPAERNILINPGHVLFGQIRIGEPELRASDRRLFGIHA